MSWQACLFCFPYGNFFLHLPPFHFQDQNIISLYCLPHIPHFIYLFTKNLLLNPKNIPIDIFLPSLLLYIVRRFPLNLSWEWKSKIYYPNCFLFPWKPFDPETLRLNFHKLSWLGIGDEVVTVVYYLEFFFLFAFVISIYIDFFGYYSSTRKSFKAFWNHENPKWNGSFPEGHRYD